MVQIRRAIYPCILNVKMDNKSEVSWLFSSTEFLAFVKLENTNTGSGGGCGGGHQRLILFQVCYQLRDYSALEFDADVGTGELMYLYQQEIPRVF